MNRKLSCEYESNGVLQEFTLSHIEQESAVKLSLSVRRPMMMTSFSKSLEILLHATVKLPLSKFS